MASLFAVAKASRYWIQALEVVYLTGIHWWPDVTEDRRGYPVGQATVAGRLARPPRRSGRE